LNVTELRARSAAERLRSAVGDTRRQWRADTRRRWGRVGVGAAAAVLGAWMFASLYRSADDAREVVVMAAPVERYSVIDPGDLRVARVRTDQSVVGLVDGSRLDEVVGRIASTDLPAASLLVDDHLLPVGHRLVERDEAVVGLVLRPGDGPLSNLEAGSRVAVVVRPPPGGNGEPVEVSGWVFDAADDRSPMGERDVEIVVARGDAATVSAAAAERRVSLLLTAG
jgi:hypothetical protein